MAAEVKFENNVVKVKNAMRSIALAKLEEVTGELESQAKRNTRVAAINGGNTKNNWKHTVTAKGDEFIGTVGNTTENAIWEEFGTGEHALDKGRSGYWVFVKGSDGKSSNTGKSYTLQEAKKVMAILRSKGLDAYYTNGKKPSRALHKAWATLKNSIINYLQNSFKGL